MRKDLKTPLFSTKTNLPYISQRRVTLLQRWRKNQTTYEEVENWLDQELASFFDTDETTRTINYGNWIKFIQRAS